MQRLHLALAISWLALSFTSTMNAAPIINNNPSSGSTDLFDVQQGAIVTSSSALVLGSDARSAIGYVTPNPTNGYTEPSKTIFADSPAIPTDFIEFQTIQPIDLSSYNLVLEEDNVGSGLRAANAFRLYASDSSSTVLSRLIDSVTLSPTYLSTYGSHTLGISDVVNVSNVQFFRLEIDRASFTGFSGPRVTELDGFGPAAVPEPSSIVLFGLAAVGLFIAARRRCWR